jgi:hypothetical protein
VLPELSADAEADPFRGDEQVAELSLRRLPEQAVEPDGSSLALNDDDPELLDQSGVDGQLGPTGLEERVVVAPVTLRTVWPAR